MAEPSGRITLRRLACATGVAALFATGCSSTPDQGGNDRDVLTGILATPDAVAVARMEPVGGSRVEGRVNFFQYGKVVVVRVNFIGLEANREYGLHVHEKGDCRGADGAAAGGHFDPGGAPHGRPGRGPHHAGDLPNVQTLGEGAVFYAYETSLLSISAGPAGVVGRSVILTRDADDHRTQPDGRSGPPLACGLVRLN
jgi:Cu-Zn family superoxide dismutase